MRVRGQGRVGEGRVTQRAREQDKNGQAEGEERGGGEETRDEEEGGGLGVGV